MCLMYLLKESLNFILTFSGIGYANNKQPDMGECLLQKQQLYFWQECKKSDGALLTWGEPFPGEDEGWSSENSGSRECWW